MQYFGGKFRIAGKIVEIIPTDRPYVEPFVGGCNVLVKVKNKIRVASDANGALISMWKAVQDGWEPPSVVTEEDYEEAKTLPELNPLKAFIGFGCSFAGKWFGGYARGDNGRNYALNAKNSMLKILPYIKAAKFKHSDYRKLNYPKNCVIYCDPPYKGTTQYGAVGEFNTEEFYEFYKKKAMEGNRVLISEYIAPKGWRIALEINTKTDIRTKANGKENRVEKVFTWAGRNA